MGLLGYLRFFGFAVGLLLFVFELDFNERRELFSTLAS